MIFKEFCGYSLHNAKDTVINYTQIMRSTNIDYEQ